MCAGSWDNLCVSKAPTDDTEPGEQSGSRAASGTPAPAPAPAPSPLPSGRRTPTATDAAAAAAPEPEKPHERAAEAAHAVKPAQGGVAGAILVVVIVCRIVP